MHETEGVLEYFSGKYITVKTKDDIFILDELAFIPSIYHNIHRKEKCKILVKKIYVPFLNKRVNILHEIKFRGMTFQNTRVNLT